MDKTQQRSMHTVLLLSKYPVYRSGIKLLLLYEMNLHVIETESGEETHAYMRQHHVDLVVMDMDLPDAEGETVIHNIKHDNPKIPVVVLSSLPEQEYAIRAVKAGAAGFISSSSTKESFLAAVRAVLAQERRSLQKTL